MPMTRDEICSGLGLHPTQTYIDRIGLGRTTAILVNAMCDLSEGKKITICAHSMDYGRCLSERAKDWAVKLELDPDLVGPPSPLGKVFNLLDGGYTEVEGKLGAELHIDHHAWDVWLRNERRRTRREFQKKYAEVILS